MPGQKRFVRTSLTVLWAVGGVTEAWQPHLAVSNARRGVTLCSNRAPTTLPCTVGSYRGKSPLLSRKLTEARSSKLEDDDIPFKRQHLIARGILASLLLTAALLFSPLRSIAADTPITENVGLPDRRYWTIMIRGEAQERAAANKALVEHAVRTINTMYYDNTGGASFQPPDFYRTWRQWLKDDTKASTLETRQGAEASLKWMVSQLPDDFSRYLTREELHAELRQSNNGFLGLGVMVVSPEKANPFFGSNTAPVIAHLPPNLLQQNSRRQSPLLSAVQVSKLPVVTAVTPDSPAERAGLVVGDRVVAVGVDHFLQHPASAAPQLVQKYTAAENYVGHSDLTIAKPVYASSLLSEESSEQRDVIVAYRPTRVRLPTVLTDDPAFNHDDNDRILGGDSIVHYEMLKTEGTIFDQLQASSTGSAYDHSVGYIRLTRFSRASTAGFIHATKELEKAGATSFIIDLRNNYGGVIQEAMLTASTLLRDPHAVLCFTMNSQGGFTPHDVEEYVMDKRYPGYFLSREPTTATLAQVKRENPKLFASNGAWVPPSSFASLREQGVTRGIHRASTVAASKARLWDASLPVEAQPAKAQKRIVLLINEGTASSAEVFAAALHDNGRTVALVGTKTYGKGLIQHTFPMPDGGGLRLTVAEYLTPALRHVSRVGGAGFDRTTGEWVGGGISPDIRCESRQGIPRNIGADLCVGMALDALQE